MKSEELRQTATRAIEELAAALEAGQSEVLTSYLAAVARFHRYSLLCVPEHRNENMNSQTM